MLLIGLRVEVLFVINTGGLHDTLRAFITTELSGGRLTTKQQLKALHTADPESCKMRYSSPSA